MTALQTQAEKGFVGLLGLFGKSADEAKAIWKQLGIDLTGNNKMTFKGMEEVIADFKKNAGQIMTTLATDITTKLITGTGDWKTIFAKALSSMLSLLLQTALQAVLTAEIVQKALKWMWSPIGGSVIIGALAALAALQAAFSKQTEATPMADGGIVTKPTLALIGEAGPEAVIPLSRGRRGTGAGGVTVNVTVTGNNISGDREADALARKVAQSITDQLRRQGIKPAYSY
jgi:phage-related minor tail protein